jgi:hypothetical protein
MAQGIVMAGYFGQGCLYVFLQKKTQLDGDIWKKIK